MWVTVAQRTVVNSTLIRQLKTSLPLFSEVTRTRWFFKRSADKMAQEIRVEGFDAYIKAKEENQGKTLFALFCGSKGSSGASWCPDCVAAEPVIDECIKQAPAETVLIRCGVGQRDFWKDPDNVFRKQLHIRSVPTLLKVGTPRKLEEGQCADKNLVQMFFEEED